MKFKANISRRLIFSASIAGIALSLVFQNCTSARFPGLKVMSSESAQASGSATEPQVVVVMDLAANTIISEQQISINFIAKVSSPHGFELKCFINGLEYKPCRSPWKLNNLENGDHVILIQASTENGRLISEASEILRVDLDPPNLKLYQTPPKKIGTTSTSIAYRANDSLSGLEAVECSLDGEKYRTCQSSPAAFTDLTVGNHIVKFRARDRAGNYSEEKSVHFEVNLGTPILSLIRSPDTIVNRGNVMFEFTALSAAGIKKFKCALDAGIYEDCESPKKYENLGHGTHSFFVVVVDEYDQMSIPLSYQFDVDNLGPSLPNIKASLNSPTRRNTVALSFYAEDPSGVASYECKVDMKPYEVCASPKIFRELESGSRIFKVRAKDMAGNYSPEAAVPLMVDLDAPVVHITEAPQVSTLETEAKFSFSTSDSLSGMKLVECQLDGQNFEICSEAQKYTGLIPGSHQFRIRVTDNAGNSRNMDYHWKIKPQFITRTEGVLKSMRSDLCVNVSSLEPNSPAIPGHCQDSRRLVFKEVEIEKEEVTLKVLNSSFCLDVLGLSPEAETPIGVFTCHNGKNQTWKKLIHSDGSFSLKSKLSDLCIEFQEGSSDEASILQMPCTDKLTQKFILTEAPEVAGSLKTEDSITE